MEPAQTIVEEIAVAVFDREVPATLDLDEVRDEPRRSRLRMSSTSKWVENAEHNAEENAIGAFEPLTTNAFCLHRQIRQVLFSSLTHFSSNPGEATRRRSNAGARNTE